MQNSKLTSIIILILVLIYFLFSQIYLSTLGNIFVYVINPLFFMVLCLILKLKSSPICKESRYKKVFLHYIIIALAIYYVVYFLSGLFLSYGNNPYAVGIKGILLNLYSVGIVLFCREYIRFRVINSVYEKDRKLICIITAIIFALLECLTVSFRGNIDIYYVFKIVFSVFLPSLSKSILFTYIGLYTNYIPSFVYSLFMYLMLWIPPILPNVPWFYTAIADILFPMILLFYCIYFISTNDKHYIYKSIKASKPKGLIPIVIGCVIIVWFAIGIFPIRPVGVATASMEPELSIGDLVIVQKCTSNDIEVGTIIEYKRKDFSVIHRVIEKNTKEGEIAFITKGDNNTIADNEPVYENQVIGKVIFKVPYMAWPTVWLSNFRGETPSVDVEIGK